MVKIDTLPYGIIDAPKALGQYVRVRRKQQGTTQLELASLCGVGIRFISDLENGKSTIELGKTLQVLKCLGLEVTVNPRGWRDPERSK